MEKIMLSNNQRLEIQNFGENIGAIIRYYDSADHNQYTINVESNQLLKFIKKFNKEMKLDVKIVDQSLIKELLKKRKLLKKLAIIIAEYQSSLGSERTDKGFCKIIDLLESNGVEINAE